MSEEDILRAAEAIKKKKAGETAIAKTEVESSVESNTTLAAFARPITKRRYCFACGRRVDENLEVK